jgi:CRP-like cAMP-binding protein
VGELAFTLGRPRTADLIALTNVALLSFNMTEISKRIPEDGPTPQARAAIHRFINSRVLEHISHTVPYLLGIDRKGPLAIGRKFWRLMRKCPEKV